MKTHVRQDTETRSITEQAVDWLSRLEEDASKETRVAFSVWVSQSPRNIEAFLRASSLNTTLNEMGGRRVLGELPNPLPNLESFVVSLPRRKEAPLARRMRLGMKAWAVAASVAVISLTILGGWILRNTGGGWHSYESAIGEQRTVALEDGSTLYLSPASRLKLRFGRNERHLRLESGEAMFKVAHDTARPFRVYTGEAIVQAIGTQFNVVKRVHGDVVVSVVEGTVQVARDLSLVETLVAPVSQPAASSQPVRVTAGEEIRLSEHGTATSPPKRAAIDPMQAWRERRLTFVNEDLETIADQFNRYNRTQIRIEDKVAAGFRYAVSIDADDPQSVLDVLRQDPQLIIENRGGEIQVRARSAADRRTQDLH